MGTNDKLAVLIFVFSLALLMKTPISNPGDFCPFAARSRNARQGFRRNEGRVGGAKPRAIEAKISFYKKQTNHITFSLIETTRSVQSMNRICESFAGF